jgi:hypothetical protein
MKNTIPRIGLYKKEKLKFLLFYSIAGIREELTHHM